MFYQVLISGIALGGIYALIGLGYDVTFWTLKIINFAQGDFLMFAVMLSIGLGVLWFKMPLVIAVIISLIIVSALGILLQKVAIEPLLKFPTSTGWIVSTMGAGIILQNVAVILWGTIEMAFPYWFGKPISVKLGPANIDLQWILIFIITVVIMYLFEKFTNGTLLGKAIKATASDKMAATSVGINTRFIVTLSMVMSVVLAGIAGLLIAPLTSANPFMGSLIGTKGFAAAVLGGMGSPRGAFFGGLVIGMSEILASAYIDPALKDAIALIILFLVLAFFPNGIMGRQYEEKV